MVEVDIKLLEIAYNHLELELDHFKENHNDTKLNRDILLKIIMAKNLVDGAIKEIESNKATLILERKE